MLNEPDDTSIKSNFILKFTKKENVIILAGTLAVFTCVVTCHLCSDISSPTKSATVMHANNQKV